MSKYQYVATNDKDTTHGELVDSEEGLKLVLTKHFNKTWSELENEGWKIKEYRTIRLPTKLRIC